LKDLFEDREKFLGTMSQTIWQRAWWVDEERGAVVLVARGGAAVEVAIESGKPSRLKRERAIELAEQAALRQDPGGDQAVPALVELGGTHALVGLIGHEETPKARRAAIAAALAASGDSTLIDELAREFQDSEIDTAERLLGIGARVDPDRLHRALVDYETTLLKLLTRGSSQIGWLADHFAMVPTSQAVKPLLRALKKHQHDAKLAPRIIAALKPCTGRDFGAEAGAWLKAYKVK